MDDPAGEPASAPAPPPPGAAGSPGPGASTQSSPPGKRRRTLSAAELAARRANLLKARAADKDLIYRPTERRRAASRANIQKAIAWRRSPEGNARARLNALQHGLAVKKLPELLARLGEAPEDFLKHFELVRQVFRPESDAEWLLIERLAQATWRRIRILRARARLESLLWRRLMARAGKPRRLSLEEITDRATAISRRLERAHRVEVESYRLEGRIERILESLLRARAKEEGIRD
ncbi:MAG: hypothetical protein LAO07_03545 [Acidobacteriia bacterium]|nr:hypothetical protein [Terriglobia bacterium]